MDEREYTVIQQSLLCVLEETLHSHQGVYLEPGTSLLEVLGTIGADLASRRFAGSAETIAGHADHARYYLQHTVDFLEGRNDGTFDVPESWKVTTVDEAGWTAVRSALEAAYGQTMRLVATTPDWAAEGRLVGILGLLAHSAFHLAAIRQLRDRR